VSQNPHAEKRKIREAVWDRLMVERQAAFPFPIEGRIPNFKGAASAANRLAELPEFQAARVVKVNPDSPQRPVRRLVLESGKTLLMPTPRLKGGFVRVDPRLITPREYARAASISGAFELGDVLPLDKLPTIDLLVFGTVAVSPDGSRVGKGEGYAELEYATLRELGRIGEDVPIATTVNDAQLVDAIPVEPFDVPVDIVVTPTRVIRPTARPSRPAGILWEHLAPERLQEMPILLELHERRNEPVKYGC
jgi:5-formyltetrahydrofolate cyclo-ligase